MGKESRAAMRRRRMGFRAKMHENRERINL